jgi:hypothetical protein
MDEARDAFSDDLNSLDSATRRRGKLQCRMCGSFDVWRIADRPGLIGTFMRWRGRKPLECRACGWRCYRVLRRKTDEIQPARSDAVDVSSSGQTASPARDAQAPEISGKGRIQT